MLLISALEEVAPENAVLVNATARAPMTAGVSEEAQLQTVVRNSLTGFPDLLAGKCQRHMLCKKNHMNSELRFVVSRCCFL